MPSTEMNQWPSAQEGAESLCLLLNHCFKALLFFLLMSDRVIAEAGIARRSSEFFPCRHQRLRCPTCPGPAAIAEHAVVRWGQGDGCALAGESG